LNRADSTSTIPTDGTSKFTIVAQYINAGTFDGHTGPKSMFFYCAEANAGSTVTDWERTNLNESTVQPNEALRLPGAGGLFQPSNNASPGAPVSGYAAAGKYHVWAAFDDLLTLAEAQAIHDDWLGTLFESAAGETITLTPDPASATTADATETITITRSAASSGTTTYNLTSGTPATATVPATATITDGNTTGTFNATIVAAGTTTITATNAADSEETDSVVLTVAALKGISLTFGQVSLTGLDWAWFDSIDPATWDAPAVSGSAESTDGSGVLSIDLTGTTLDVGQQGMLVIWKEGATRPDDVAYVGIETVADIG
jgi:hypothetical protein